MLSFIFSIIIAGLVTTLMGLFTMAFVVALLGSIARILANAVASMFSSDKGST